MKLLRYIQGFRKGKDAHHIEMDAMKDLFLSEALEGYDSVKDNHAERIARMQKQISNRSFQSKNKIIPWSIAAGLFICFFIGSYFIIKQDNKPNLIAEKIIGKNQQEEIRKMIPVPDSSIIENNNQTQQTKTKKPVSIYKKDSTQKYSGNEDKQATIELIPPVTIAEVTIPSNKIDSVPNSNISLSGYLTEKVTGIQAQDVFSKANIRGIVVDTTQSILSTMKESSHQLAEVVVVGYGTQKKRDITGSVSRINIEKTQAISPEPVIGKKAYQDYLKTNCIQPSEKSCKKGEVTIEFRVNYQGRPYDIQVIKSLCPEADVEAIRLIEKGSNWTYGTKKIKINIKFQPQNKTSMKKLKVPAIQDLSSFTNWKDVVELLIKKGVSDKINTINWKEYPYCPPVTFYIARTDSSLYILYDVTENGIRAVNTEYHSSVWEDSCVEFFMQLPGDDCYRNFEFNCIGTTLAAVRKNRNDFTRFSDSDMKRIKTCSGLPRQTVVKEEQTHWKLLVEIPFSLMGINPKEKLNGKIIKANLYKCGDKTKVPHYVSWNPISTEKPNFHVPEFMGELEL